MAGMKISIAMATYNGAKYLQEQLDSFVNQTRKPDELVVCDDGSTDETLDVLEKFKKESPFAVRIYQNESNLGYIKNFDKALALCSGDIVFLSDQDDVWLPEKLEIIEQDFVKNSEVMVVLNDQIITDDSLMSTGSSTLGNIRLMGFNDSWHSAGCCTTVRKIFLDIICPIPNEAHGHDGWINTLSEALNVRLVIDSKLQYYRRHNVNTSNSIATRTSQVSSFDVVKEYGLKDVTQGWRRQIDLCEKYKQRLIDKTKILEKLNLKQSKDKALEELSKKIISLEHRILIVSKPRWRRIVFVIRFWFDGGYGHFSGWKSVIKDILR